MVSNYRAEFETFLELAKHLLVLAELLIEKEKSGQIKYIDFELIYNNLFDEFMRTK